MTEKLSPRDGGCWFCHTKVQVDDNGLFSGEFDTNLHKTCLSGILKEDPSHQEARIMAREFDMELPPDPTDELDYENEMKLEQYLKTVYMGPNTEPRFELEDKHRKVLDKYGSTPDGLIQIKEKEPNSYLLICEHLEALKFKKEIEEACNVGGGCNLSFSCDGRTRHQQQSQWWVDKLNEVNGNIYEADIDYQSYQCRITLKITS